MKGLIILRIIIGRNTLKYMEIAIIYDIKKEYIKAVEGYTTLIRNNDTIPDYYINLSFLYWSFAFELYEFITPNNIPEYWIKKGGDEFLKILDLGIEKYPKDIELHFWRKYFLHISYAEDFTEEECVNLFNLYGHKNKIPYFFLYQYDNIRYKKQRDELLQIIKGKKTAKNLYVESLL